MNTIEILEAMKSNLMTRGWNQGYFEAEDGSVCLMGSWTRTGLNLTDEESGAVHNALWEVDSIRWGGGIFGFNDAFGRKFNDVIDVIDAAILKEKTKDATN